MLYDLKVFQRTFDFMFWLKPIVERFAKVHKYSLGIQLENEVILLLREITRANLKKDKKESIEECFVHYEMVKILIRLTKEFKLINIKQYEFASIWLDEVGKLLGGWYGKFKG